MPACLQNTDQATEGRQNNGRCASAMREIKATISIGRLDHRDDWKATVKSSCSYCVDSEVRLTEKEDSPLQRAEHLEEGLRHCGARHELCENSHRLSSRASVDGLNL